MSWQTLCTTCKAERIDVPCAKGIRSAAHAAVAIRPPTHRPDFPKKDFATFMEAGSEAAARGSSLLIPHRNRLANPVRLMWWRHKSGVRRVTVNDRDRTIHSQAEVSYAAKPNSRSATERLSSTIVTIWSISSLLITSGGQSWIDM